jgi:hypothetical protein
MHKRTKPKLIAGRKYQYLPLPEIEQTVKRFVGWGVNSEAWKCADGFVHRFSPANWAEIKERVVRDVDAEF